MWYITLLSYGEQPKHWHTESAEAAAKFFREKQEEAASGEVFGAWALILTSPSGREAARRQGV